MSGRKSAQNGPLLSPGSSAREPPPSNMIQYVLHASPINLQSRMTNPTQTHAGTHLNHLQSSWGHPGAKSLSRPPCSRIIGSCFAFLVHFWRGFGAKQGVVFGMVLDTPYFQNVCFYMFFAILLGDQGSRATTFRRLGPC